MTLPVKIRLIIETIHITIIKLLRSIASTIASVTIGKVLRWRELLSPITLPIRRIETLPLSLILIVGLIAKIRLAGCLREATRAKASLNREIWLIGILATRVRGQGDERARVAWFWQWWEVSSITLLTPLRIHAIS